MLILGSGSSTRLGRARKQIEVKDCQRRRSAVDPARSNCPGSSARSLMSEQDTGVSRVGSAHRHEPRPRRRDRNGARSTERVDDNDTSLRTGYGKGGTPSCLQITRAVVRGIRVWRGTVTGLAAVGAIQTSCFPPCRSRVAPCWRRWVSKSRRRIITKSLRWPQSRYRGRSFPGEGIDCGVWVRSAAAYPPWSVRTRYDDTRPAGAAHQGTLTLALTFWAWYDR